jgi:hypothetical protein
MRGELVRNGFSIAAGETRDDIGYKYALMEMRRIPARPRRVHVATGFACPAEHAAGLAEIRRKVESGESLAPHQRLVRETDSEDALLNDWGVQHFHLGLTPDARGLVNRTGPLLFARVTASNFYMIRIFKHRVDWSRQSIVQTIRDNWPDSIAGYEAGERPEMYPSDDEITTLRKNGISPMAVTRAAVYVPLGGGIATDGSSVRAGIMSDRYFHWADDVQASLFANIDTVVSIARSKGCTMVPPFEFHLAFREDGSPCVIETNSRVRIPLTDRVPAAPSPVAP